MSKDTINILTASKKNTSIFRRLLNITEITVIVPLIIIFIIGLLVNEHFLTDKNWFGRVCFRSRVFSKMDVIKMIFVRDADLRSNA